MLYKFNPTRFTSPACQCGEGIQDSIHVATECKLVDVKLRDKMKSILSANNIHDYKQLPSNAFLISWSRDNQFFDVLLEIVIGAGEYLRAEIVL